MISYSAGVMIKNKTLETRVRLQKKPYDRTVKLSLDRELTMLQLPAIPDQKAVDQIIYTRGGQCEQEVVHFSDLPFNVLLIYIVYNIM